MWMKGARDQTAKANLRAGFRAGAFPAAATSAARGGVRLIALVIAVSLLTLQPGRTAVARESIPVKREILALYDGAQEGDADHTRIHRFAEMPLNHLGYILRFHDIRTKLPEPTEVEHYLAVLTWFAGSVSDGDSYLAWANQVSRMNVRSIVLGDVGVAINPANINAVNRLLQVTGVRHTGDYVAPTLSTQIVRKDPGLVEFECRLDPVLPEYPVLDAAGAGSRIGLMLVSPREDGYRRTVLVAIGNKGGFAAFGFEFCHPRPPLYQGRWLINPFAFFRAALGRSDFPIPDTTTIAGRRIYFSRLQSKGWTRSSRIEGFEESAAMAAEVVIHELIEPLHDLPTTLELQDRDVASWGRSAKQSKLVLQRLLAASNVDVSTRRLQGGLSRFDQEYPSIANLLPLASAGPEPRTNEPMSDETAYRSGAPVGETGFFAFKQTVVATESPRRLKPLAVSYDASVGEYPALLRSVEEQLHAARLAALAPISADRYAAIVDGFFSTQIERIGGESWQIRNRGALQTLRFDGADEREVDLRASVGVIGQTRLGAALYVALDQAVEPAIVALRPSSLSQAGQSGFSLIESRWLVRNVVKGECGLSFDVQGYGDGSLSWSTAPLRPYLVTASRDGEELWRGTAEADRAGRLDLLIPIDAIEPLTVRVRCASAEPAIP